MNLPPIMHHFHYCRSTIEYLNNNEEDDILEIPIKSKVGKKLLKGIHLNTKTKKLWNKYFTNENVIIDYSYDKPFAYNIDKDKIIINPKHEDYKEYNLQEALTHEIIHMIDIRNKISDNLNIDDELRKASLSIDTNEEKYIKLMNSDKYEDNMALGDIFSAVTNGKILGNFGHEANYWFEDTTRVKKELSANIMSAYLNNNKDAINILDSIEGLREIKDKVVRKYDAYTK